MDDEGIFPRLGAPRRLQVASLAGKDWHERVLLTSLQGLVNRTEPRIYLVNDGCDERWLDYYGVRFGVRHEKMADPLALVEMFGDQVDGYVVYDDGMLHTVNVAATLGGIRNAVPVAPQLEPLLQERGLRKIEDLRGRWEDRCAGCAGAGRRRGVRVPASGRFYAAPEKGRGRGASRRTLSGKGGAAHPAAGGTGQEGLGGGLRSGGGAAAPDRTPGGGILRRTERRSLGPPGGGTSGNSRGATVIHT